MAFKCFVTVCLWALFQTTAAYSLIQSTPNNPYSQFLTAPVSSGYEQFSTCFYVNLKSPTSITKQVPLLAYLSGDAAEIIFQLEYARQASSLSIGGGNGVFFPSIPSANTWTHICLTWNGNSGLVNAYKDGAIISSAEDIQTGYRIPVDGTWNLAKSLGDVGQVTQLQFWDRVISDLEVLQAFSCEFNGNVFSWGGVFSDDNDPCVSEEVCYDHGETSELDLVGLYGDGYYIYEVEGSFESSMGKQRDFTVCAWFYIEEYTKIDALILYNRDGLNIFKFHFLKDGTVRIMIGSDDEEEYEDRYFSLPIDYYDWQHYCISWTSDDGRTEVFVNGNLQHVELDLIPGISISSGAELFVYQLQYLDAEDDDAFKGFAFKASDVNWWDYVLSRGEVQEVYSCSGSSAGNMLSWVNDEFYYYDDWVATCRAEPVTSSFLDLQDVMYPVYTSVETIDPIPDMAEITTCAWYYIADSDFKSCIGLTDQYYLTESSSDDDFSIHYCPPDNEQYNLPGYGFELGDNSYYWNGAYTPPLNEWHHLCLTWEGFDGYTELYINGEFVADHYADEDTIITSGVFHMFNAQSGKLDNRNLAAGFEAKQTEFNMWDYVLTEDEVLEVLCEGGYGNVINEDTEWSEISIERSPQNFQYTD